MISELRKQSTTNLYSMTLKDNTFSIEIRGNQSYVNSMLVNDTGGVEVVDTVELAVDSDLNGASPRFTLTCISTGGPASSLLWIKNMENSAGERVTTLVDPTPPLYTHALTVTGRQPGTYKCIVSNNKPSQDFATFTVKGRQTYSARHVLLTTVLI